MKAKRDQTRARDKTMAAAPRKAPPKLVVHVEFEHPTAHSVNVAGSFNDWSSEATPMEALGKGKWAKDLSLRAGRHEYCLVVDGKWMWDPTAPERIANPFGGFNSVLRVGRAARSRSGARAHPALWQAEGAEAARAGAVSAICLDRFSRALIVRRP